MTANACCQCFAPRFSGSCLAPYVYDSTACDDPLLAATEADLREIERLVDAGVLLAGSTEAFERAIRLWGAQLQWRHFHPDRYDFATRGHRPATGGRAEQPPEVQVGRPRGADIPPGIRAAIVRMNPLNVRMHALTSQALSHPITFRSMPIWTREGDAG